MAMRDIYPTTGVKSALYKAFTSGDSTTPEKGNALDIRGFNSVLFAVTANFSETDTAAFKLSVEHCDDNSSFEEATGEYIVGPSGELSEDMPVQKIGYVGARRYVKLVVTPTTAASTATVTVAGHAILQRPEVAPVE